MPAAFKKLPSHRSGVPLRPFAAALFCLSAWCVAPALSEEVSGRVLTPDKDPQEGARITLSEAGSGTVVGETRSDKKGKFEIKVSSEVVDFVLRIEHEDFGPHIRDVRLDGQDLKGDFRLLDLTLWKQQLAVETFNRGVQYLQAGDDLSAEADFLEAIELNPGLPNSYAALSTIYHSGERWEETAEVLDKFFELAGPVPDLAPVAFDAYRKTGQDEKAAAALAQVQDPAGRAEMAIGVYNDGVELNRAEDVDGAMALFVQAAELDPNLAAAHHSIAALEFNAGKYEEALPHIDRALSLEPEHQSALRMRFYSLLESGESDLGPAASAYLDTTPGAEVGLLVEATELFDRHNDPDGADARVQALVAARPENCRAHYLLGRVSASKSRIEEAKSHLQTFVEQCPDDPDVEVAGAMRDAL